jgi:hypothetical protein
MLNFAPPMPCNCVVQLRASQGDVEDLQQQLKSAEAAIRDQQFKTALLLAETEKLKGNTQVSNWVALLRTEWTHGFCLCISAELCGFSKRTHGTEWRYLNWCPV